MRTAATLLLLSVLASPVHAADTLFRLTEVATIAAHGSDLATTENCLGRGVCHELNGWLARFDRPLVFGAAKMGVAAGQLWLVDKLHDRHPKLAILVNTLTSSAFFTIAAHNARVSR